MTDQNTEYLENAQGHLVPKQGIKPARLLEDEMVKTLHYAAAEVQQDIKSFKESAFKHTQDLLDVLAQNYDLKRGGKKGGSTFTSFDGMSRVVINVQDFIAFGAELEIAKELVDQCIRKWLENGTNKEIGKLVAHAFRINNGRINVRDVLRLKQIEINDDTWRKAMLAIDDAIRVESSKTYIRFQERKAPELPWETIPLDIAKV